MSRTKVAGAMPKPGPQYCVNIAAAMVNVTMLMQLASLLSSISVPSLYQLDVSLTSKEGRLQTREPHRQTHPRSP